jgi:predicted homoserine dehydrogenase-like protein
VTFRAHTDYVRKCFHEYGLVTDASGTYSAMYKPFHLISLELGISVASIGLRGEPTGAATDFRGDVVATAKRDLKAGETLDGEGGYTVWGKLMPAAHSLACGGLPLGLAHGAKLVRPITRGQAVTWSDIVPLDNEAAQVRREMERLFAGPTAVSPGR